MDKQYFQEYYAFEREHWWFRARSHILAEQVLRLLPESTRRPEILNVGAAMGASSEMLARYGNVVSVEYERDCCTYVAQQFGQIFINASITELPFRSHAFDLVSAFDVIEHVDDDAAAARELMRVCRPGGVVIVTVPAFMMLWSHHDAVNHHRRRYRASELKRLFAGSGRVIYVSYFNSFLFFPIAAIRGITRLVPQRWIRRGAGSDFSLIKSGLADAVCYRLLRSESPILRRGVSFPVGVSAILAWRNDPSNP